MVIDYCLLFSLECLLLFDVWVTFVWFWLIYWIYWFRFCVVNALFAVVFWLVVNVFALITVADCLITLVIWVLLWMRDSSVWVLGLACVCLLDVFIFDVSFVRCWCMVVSSFYLTFLKVFGFVWDVCGFCIYYLLLLEVVCYAGFVVVDCMLFCVCAAFRVNDVDVYVAVWFGLIIVAFDCLICKLFWTFVLGLIDFLFVVCIAFFRRLFIFIVIDL